MYAGGLHVFKNNLRSIIFALVMSILCSVLLAGIAEALKAKQQLNVELDIKKNILKALSISDKSFSNDDEKALYYSSLSGDQISSLYSGNVKEIVVSDAGEVIEGVEISKIKEGDKTKLPVYLKVSGESIEAYCIPIQGKGLWSTIKGYFALEKDLNTVKGVTFYSQGETAGLGAEIAQNWFQKNYTGKKILDNSGSLKSVTIVKGTVDPASTNAEHEVDGISGATMTGKGINIFLMNDLKIYENYFKAMRKNNG
jgi:Na+-transporting NADH:ubiquinone oxidoreductase subunit C